MAQRSPLKGRRLAPTTACQHCNHSHRCLPGTLTGKAMDDLNRLVERGQTIERGGLVFRQGTPFRGLYAVRSGAIKTFLTNAQGEAQITSFYLPGDIIGLDSLGGENVYASTAKAIEYTHLCKIPFAPLQQLAAKVPLLQHHLFHLLSQEVRESQQHLMLLSKGSAENRIASLLGSLSARYLSRRLSPCRFRLPMPRSDMANYLGLAGETVSRVLARLQQQKLISLHGRELHLKDNKLLGWMLPK